jgi:hypothetical protein
MKNCELTKYNLQHNGYLCIGVWWGANIVKCKRLKDRKTVYFIQSEYIHSSADTDHIRNVIDNFKPFTIWQLAKRLIKGEEL